VPYHNEKYIDELIAAILIETGLEKQDKNKNLDIFINLEL